MDQFVKVLLNLKDFVAEGDTYSEKNLIYYAFVCIGISC